MRHQLREAQGELQQRQEHLTREQQRCDDLEAQLLMQVGVKQDHLGNIQGSMGYVCRLLACHSNSDLARIFLASCQTMLAAKSSLTMLRASHEKELAQAGLLQQS